MKLCMTAMKLDPLTRRTLSDWCGIIVIPLHSYGNCLSSLYSTLPIRIT
jgi:hypothetical protein